MLILNRMPLAQIQNEMNSLLNSMFTDMPRGLAPVAPPMNVWEDGQNYFIEAELPGFSLSDVEVSVADNEITISGKRAVKEAENATYLRRERSSGEFTRTWTLPAEVASDRVQASLSNGILLVTLPKSEKAMPRKIEVRSA